MQTRQRKKTTVAKYTGKELTYSEEGYLRCIRDHRFSDVKMGMKVTWCQPRIFGADGVQRPICVVLRGSVWEVARAVIA